MACGATFAYEKGRCLPQCRFYGVMQGGHKGCPYMMGGSTAYVLEEGYFHGNCQWPCSGHA